MGLGTWWRNRKSRIWTKIAQLYLKELEQLGGPDAPPLTVTPAENYYTHIAAAKEVYAKAGDAVLFAQEALSDLSKVPELKEKVAAIITAYREVVSSFRSEKGIQTTVYIHAALKKNSQIEELMKKIEAHFYRCPVL
ncbi:MAG TPA: hypothetical protein VJG90_08410 [Candidatus Nanoarchaeia archaeon]|nr:hypothetical protein [Candidatus Nanoarchaeia archaeon]